MGGAAGLTSVEKKSNGGTNGSVNPILNRGEHSDDNRAHELRSRSQAYPRRATKFPAYDNSLQRGDLPEAVDLYIQSSARVTPTGHGHRRLDGEKRSDPCIFQSSARVTSTGNGHPPDGMYNHGAPGDEV